MVPCIYWAVMIRGSVWQVEFDPSVSSEMPKTRPAVIISNNMANKYYPRVVVIPLASNISHVYPSEAIVTVNGDKNKAMVDQIMVADKSRLKNQISELSETDMRSIGAVIKRYFGYR